MLNSVFLMSPRREVWGFFGLSRIAHSCAPNCAFHFSKNKKFGLLASTRQVQKNDKLGLWLLEDLGVFWMLRYVLVGWSFCCLLNL